jgi:hypothetical protein
MWFLYALAFWLAAVASHALLCRLSLPLGTVVRFLIMGGAAGSCLIWVSFRPYGMWSPQTFPALSAYSFLCELYLFLITLVQSSISSNLLLILRDRSLSEKDLVDLYDSSRMVSMRIERLLATGLLSEAGGELRLTKHGARIATRFIVFKRFFGHPMRPSCVMENRREYALIRHGSLRSGNRQCCCGDRTTSGVTLLMKLLALARCGCYCTACAAQRLAVSRPHIR